MEEEHATFLRYAETTRINSTLFDHTGNGDTHYAIRLNGSENERIGLAKSLAVMTGDTIRAEAYAKYLDPDPSNWTTALQNLMAAIAGGTAPTGTVIEAVPPSSGEGFPFAGLLDGAKAGDTGPQAYLNILVFDENLIFVDCAFVPVTTAAMENGTDVPHEKLSQEIVVQQPGFVYIYLSNDNGQPLEVFFDDFTVEHVHSVIVQADDYYPFGMTFNEYRREDSMANKYKYNGKEEQQETGWLDYGARMYMPDIGRFFTQDRFATKYFSLSPYQYAANNPIKNIDVNGDSINVSNLITQNGKLSAEGLYTLFNMVSDLSDITGQNFSVNGSGNLVSDGKINKDKNGNQIGSKSARKYVNGLIGSTRDIKVTNDNSKSTQGGGIGSVNINSDQIDNNIASMQSAGLGELTFGYGMSFLHESMHTATGTFVMNPSATTAIGDPSPTTPNAQGPTVTNVNVFRNELGLPERSHYFWQQTSTTAPKTMRWNQGGKTTTVTQGTMTPAVKQQSRGIINAILNFRLP